MPDLETLVTPDPVDEVFQAKPDQHGPKNPHLTPRDHHWITISSKVFYWDPSYLLGDGQITYSDGLGGWQSVGRPDEKAISDWPGVEMWKMTVPLLIDSWAADLDPPPFKRTKEPPDFKKKKHRRRHREQWRQHRDRHIPQNVHQYVTLLRQLGTPIEDGASPPSFRVYGKAVPTWLNGEAWTLGSIEWGAYLINKENGRLIRQALTLNLVEFVDVDDYKLRKKKKRHGGKDHNGHGGKGHGNKHHHHHHRTKAGENLQKIAAAEYGDWTKWKDIADANGIRNPRKVEPGTLLVIP